jgi:hypothetical protein
VREELIESIRSSGYWRVNLRPTGAPRDYLLGECRKLVRDAAVSMRGWDYPHVTTITNDEGGDETADGYVENWCNWSGFKEFWRMYPSGQFLSYTALREETLEGMFQTGGKGTIAVDHTIYSFTEIFEFAHRLALRGVYPDGANIMISLEGAMDRRLWLGPNPHVRFFGNKSTSATRIELDASLSPETLQDGYREQAVILLVRLFDRFGWNPPPAQIAAVQERFYRKEF